MVVGDATPVWSDLGQTMPVGHRPPGRQMTYCPADAFEEECQDPDNPYGGPANELFGVGTIRIPDSQDSLGQVRLMQDQELAGFGQFTKPFSEYRPEIWTILGSIALVFGSVYLKGNWKSMAHTMGLVAGGVGVASTLSKLSS